jgi:hypothetical protein
MPKKTAVITSEHALQEPSSVYEKTEELRAETSAGNGADETAIAELAYRFWQERGCPEGSPEDDWFLAERQLSRSSELIAAGDERSTPRESHVATA